MNSPHSGFNNTDKLVGEVEGTVVLEEQALTVQVDVKASWGLLIYVVLD